MILKVADFLDSAKQDFSDGEGSDAEFEDMDEDDAEDNAGDDTVIDLD